MKKLEFNKEDVLGVHTRITNLVNTIGKKGYFSDSIDFKFYAKGTVVQVAITDLNWSSNEYIFKCDNEDDYFYFIPEEFVKELKEIKILKFDKSKVYSKDSNEDDLIKLYREKAEGYFSGNKNFDGYILSEIKGLNLTSGSAINIFIGKNDWPYKCFIKKEDAEETIKIEEIKE